MTAFLPGAASGGSTEPDHPRLTRRPVSPSEQRARWEVRAAQWRAREIAESVFGGVSGLSLIGMRPAGALRGLLNLEVPFQDLESHLARERRFLAAVAIDPVLAQVPLVYVFAPDVG